MRYLEKYTGNKTFMFPNGDLATPEKILEQFPAILAFPHVIETDAHEQVLFAVMNLSAMRDMHNIDPALSDDDAIEAIENIMNAPPPEAEPSANERIAAALEWQNILTM